jgi:hypothetical protein
MKEPDFHITVLLEDDNGGALFDKTDLYETEKPGDVGPLLEQAVDKELDTFNSFSVEKLGEPLANPERAILKTYFAWKLGMGQEQKKDAG